MTEPITCSEIKKVISQLNTKKSPGPDGLPAEFYQIFNDDISEILKESYNEGLNGENMHRSFYHSIISLIYKKGDKSNIDNYRQINLMNVDYKIFAKIIINRMNEYLNEIIEREQTCAIKGRFMWDNTCTLRDLINNKTKEYSHTRPKKGFRLHLTRVPMGSHEVL